MVGIGVNEDGYREVIGCAESSERRRDFLSWLKSRGLRGVRMFVGDKAAGMGRLDRRGLPRRQIPALHRALLPQRPRQGSEIEEAAGGGHAQGNPRDEVSRGGRRQGRGRGGGRESMRLKEAAKVVRDGYAETLAYCGMPREHWRRIRTNNAIERLNRETRRRTRVVGIFPDGKSALMLVAARLKYVADSEWGSRRYLDVSPLKEQSC